MGNKVALVFFACLFVVGVSGQDDCDSMALDYCGEFMWKHVMDLTLVPTNDEELARVCKDLHTGVECIKDYTKRCPEIHGEEHVDRFVHAMETTTADICEGHLGQRLLPFGLCMREKLAPIFTCNSDIIPLFEAVAVYEPLSERLHLACCVFVNMERCITNTTVSACGRPANKAVKIVFQNYATYIIERCLNTLASGHKCNLRLLDGIQPKNGRKAKTVMPAIADIVETVF